MVFAGIATGGLERLADRVTAYDGGYDDVYDRHDRLTDAIAKREQTTQRLLTDLTEIEAAYTSSYFEHTKRLWNRDVSGSLYERDGHGKRRGR
ncbi:hypothetical protein [Halocatena salina]|uniref:Uncharacterized protein n=1 Tax=Halocatena salina TaxID=2934340 RepID=A0A8U0A3P0_9EURY|nr:hypothetical protein [Halocatena salina]UPM43811.1 hypothetical protein MW046_05035 [Halocatena salina]